MVLTCIPNNEEKYISFTKDIIVDTFVNEKGKSKNIPRGLRFIDSFKFMSSGLDKLATNLNTDQFDEMKKFYEGKRLKLLLKKGVYPYDYMGKLEKLKENKLPPKESFYSKLNDFNITNEDCEHAKEVWKEFDMDTMKDYNDLYLKSDVLLLADIF